METISSSLDQNFPSAEDTIKKYKVEDWLNQNYELIDYDLISIDDPDRKTILAKILGEANFDNLKENKAIACFIGLVVGDALGAHTESYDLSYERDIIKDFEDISKLNQDLRCSIGQYTDDTSMALCLADSIIMNNRSFNGVDLRNRFFLWWISGYNNGKQKEKEEKNKLSFGIGNIVATSFNNFLKTGSDRVPPRINKKEHRNGNGTIMRLAPVPIAFIDDKIEKATEFAVLQSYTTHDGEEAAECCRLLAYILHNLFNLKNVEECKKFLDTMGDNFKSENSSVEYLAKSQQEPNVSVDLDPSSNKSIEDRDWNWKNPSFKYSPTRSIKLKTKFVGVYCMDGLAMALHLAYYAKSTKEAILKAVNLGGDADTVAAIAGMICGAIYGYDKDIQNWYVNYILKWDELKVPLRAYKLYKMSCLSHSTQEEQ